MLVLAVTSACGGDVNPGLPTSGGQPGLASTPSAGGGNTAGNGAPVAGASAAGAGGATDAVSTPGQSGGAAPDGSPASSTSLRARTWRLSHEQYSKSVEELTSILPELTAFTPESGNGKFVNFSSTAFVRVDLAAAYLSQAKSIAYAMPRQALAGLTSCALAASCSDEYVNELAARAFRRPVPETLLTPYRELFASVAATASDPEDAFRAVLAGMLNSPLFLYRKELGEEADEAAAAFVLSPHGVAELLAYSLLDAPPPDWLKNDAEAGRLTSDADLAVATTRLLDDPRAAAQLAVFLEQWMEIHEFQRVEKSDAFPGFADVKSAMQEETAAFIAKSGNQDSTLLNLLLDPVPTDSSPLTAFYLSDPSAVAGDRRGVLGLGTVLASHAKSYLTSPTQRGTFVRSRFFCQEITLPPDFTPPPLSETEATGLARTTRELYERHQSDPSCDACHRLTDNIGFALEGFDGAGRFRTLDSTQGEPAPIDLQTELTNSDVDRPLESATDLSQALAESDQVKACLARQAFRFYFGQGDPSGNVPAISLASDQIKSDGRLRQLLVGLLSTASTRERVREVGN